MIIPFVDWQPDAVDFGAQGSAIITNAVPAERSFQPFPSFAQFSNAIDSRPRGGIEAFDRDDVSHLYVGNETKLFELDSSNFTFTDRTNTGGAYSTGAGQVWNFVRFKNKILATNFSNNIQQKDMATSVANFTDLTSDFRAKNITVIGDFVVCSNTFDSSDGNVPNRVRWSGISNETQWTVSSSTLSDFRDLTTGGPIRAITGGEVGIIVSERSIFRMTFVGAPVVFQIDEILPDIGTVSGGSVTALGDNVYLISDQGFLEITANGTGVNPIGAGRVDQWFRANFDDNFPDRVFSLPDPTNNRIIWAFPGPSNEGGRPNKIVIYDKTFNKWALVEDDVEMILRAKGFSVTLENLPSLGFTNLDTIPMSFDSGIFTANGQIAAFDKNLKLGFFAGDSKSATLETGEIALNAGSKTGLSAFRPLVVGGSVTAQVGHRSKLADEVTFTDTLNPTSSGRITKRVNDCYHRFRITCSGLWEDAIGVEVDRVDAQSRGRRA